MIEFDYTIERNEGDEIRTIKPNDRIGTSLPNLAYIEAQNSMGKSTFLDILALAFFGIESPKVKETLKMKLKSYLNASQEKLIFDYKIGLNGSSSLVLQSKKTSETGKDIYVYEILNGKKKKLTHESFFKNYALIYDTPEDTLKRLEDLKKTIKEEQDEIGSRIDTFQKHIEEILQNISDYELRDELERDIEKLFNQKEKLRHEIDSAKSLENVIDNLKLLKQLDLLKSKRQEKQDMLDLLLETIDQKAKNEKRTKEIKKDLKKELGEIEKLFNEISESLEKNLPSDHPLTEPAILNRLSVDSLLREDSESIFEDLFNRILEYIEDLKSLSIDDDEEFKNIELLKELESLLSQYSSYDLELPGIKHSINEYLSVLREEIDKNSDMLKQKKLLDDLPYLIDEVQYHIENFKDTSRKLGKYGEAFNYNEIMFEDVDQQVSELTKEIEKVDEDIRYIEAICKQKKVNTSDIAVSINELSLGEKNLEYKSYSVEELEKKIIKLREDIESKSEKLSNVNVMIKDKESQIKRSATIEKSPFLSRKKDLERILRKVKGLNVKFNKDFKQYVSLQDPDKDNKELMQYLDLISIYLGKIVGTVDYFGEKKVKKINLEDGIVVLEGNKKIPFSRLSTGRSQSAFLKAQLSVKDNRKIIALFDEISTMDKKSLEPIFSVVERLYAEGRLIACIMVRPTDGETRVREIKGGDLIDW